MSIKTGEVHDEERELIPKYIEDLENCNLTRDESVDPVQANISTDMFNVYVSLVVKLYNRELTYGEFFKQLDKEHASRDLLIKQRQDELARTEQQNQQAEAIALESYRRQKIQQSFKQLQRAFEPAPQINTTCTTFGNTVRCNTR